MPTIPEQDAVDLRRRARSSGSRVARRLVDQPLRSLGVGAAVLVLAATAGFGGLESAIAPTLAPVVPGTSVAAAPFEITLDKVLWTAELPGAYLTSDGNRWLAITATVTNTADSSVVDPVIDALALAGVAGLVKEPVRGTDRVTSSARLLLADGSSPFPVQPGLAYDLVFLFEQSGEVPPPTEVTVQVLGHTSRPSTLDRTQGWFDPTVVAQATLPLREAVDTAAVDNAAVDNGAQE
ncbi:hypothetical protein [Pengzhenrongella sicca]|uniref:Uncharacterized protein n=1 Tax=Pengzhenrongella sicca TaxID=2819238 RepID=A0A8A4Z9X6_9MICO|nr:hypothetical protein [Pengzhenrongella sicca]QTE28712.1 hypothetical protein J4E96_15365 [Pengzhenrongella sicca]